MKLTLLPLAIAAFLALAGSAVASRRIVAPTPVASGPDHAITEELRGRALGAKAEDFGIDASVLPEGVWGVVMDTRYPEGLASVVALADGSASLYLGLGSGVIGGHAHERVRAAAKAAVAKASTQIGTLSATTNLEPPTLGRTKVFVLTSHGVYASDSIPEEMLGNGEHALSPVFYSVQSVITELRLASEGSR